MDISDLLPLVIKEGNTINLVVLIVFFIFQQIWSKKGEISSKEIIGKLDILAQNDIHIEARISECERSIESVRKFINCKHPENEDDSDSEGPKTE